MENALWNETAPKSGMKHLVLALFAASTSVLHASHAPAYAEGSVSTELWGTTNVGTSAGTQSATLHQTSGMAAGQVNAALRRVLYSGPNMTVVGSQNIVQVTGNNNVVTDITQEAVNSGNQSLDAPIN